MEQTLNRFLPALVVTDTLKQLGLNPGAALKSHRSLNPRDIKNKAFHDSVMKKLERNPVYDEAALKKMAARGISSLREKQLSNGSWGWFGGAEEGDPVMTAPRGSRPENCFKHGQRARKACFPELSAG